MPIREKERRSGMSLFGLLGKIFNRGKKTSAGAKTPKLKEREIGVVSHYYGNIAVAIIKLKGGLRVGDRIHIKGVHADFSQPVDSMQLNHRDIQEASKGAEVGIKVVRRAHENDRVYVPLS